MTSIRFKVDPAVEDMNKELRTRRYPAGLFIGWTIVTIALIAFIIPIVSLSIDMSHASGEAILDPLAKIMILSMGVVITVMFYPFVFSHTAKRELSYGNRLRREKQISLKKSLQVGRDLDLPVLTEDHARAGIALDHLIAQKELGWSRGETQRIRTLLFADLSREETIFSIITARGVTAADQVVRTLDEMEASGKPLQDGWL